MQIDIKLFEFKNIKFKHTYEKYNKKYRFHRKRLLSYTMDEVKEFDKKNHFAKYNKKTKEWTYEYHLLKKHKWWFIESKNTFYQVPRAFTLTWFANVNILLHLLLSLTILGAIATPIALPFILIKKPVEPGPTPPTPTPTVDEITITNEKQYFVGESAVNDDFIITAHYSDSTTKQITSGYTCDKTLPYKFIDTTPVVFTFTYESVSSSITITAQEEIIHVTSVSLNKTSTYVSTAQTKTLIPTVLPEEAKDKSVTWTSSDDNIATVEDGKIIPKAAGVVTITCTSNDNPEAKDECQATIFVADTFANTEWNILIGVTEEFENYQQDELAMKELCGAFTDVEYITDISLEITDPNRQIEAHLDNFIGKEHNVKINGLDHLINVIGINHDLIEGNANKYAAFTFETRNVLCYTNENGDIAALGTEWQDDDITRLVANNGSYPTSFLHYDLNGDSEGKSKYWMDAKTYKSGVMSGVTALDMMVNETYGGTPILKDHLKKVQKQVYTRSGSEWEIPLTSPITYSATLFPLTATEAGYKGDSVYYHEEGSPYAYWEKDTAIQAKVWVGQEFTTGNADYYWYTSPRVATADDTKSVWYYDAYYGYMGQSDTATQGRVSFAFCI